MRHNQACALMKRINKGRKEGRKEGRKDRGSTRSFLPNFGAPLLVFRAYLSNIAQLLNTFDIAFSKRDSIIKYPAIFG